MPGLANIAPRLFTSLYREFREGNRAGAELFDETIREMVRNVYRAPKNAQVGVKQGLAYLGICSAQMMPPLAQISPAEAEKINSYLESCGGLKVHRARGK